MTTIRRISPLVLKFRDRTEKLVPNTRHPWLYGTEWKVGSETWTLKEHAEELIYCRQLDRTNMHAIIKRKIQEGEWEVIEPPSERVVVEEVYMGIAEEFDPAKVLAEVKSERDL